MVLNRHPVRPFFLLQGVRIFCFFLHFAFQEAPGRHFFEIFESSGSIWAPPGRQFCDIFQIC